MTQAEIWSIAMAQSAADSSCSPADFLSGNNRVVPSRKNPAARKYLELPFLCNLTSYGNNIVASVSEPYAEIAGDYISRYAVEHCFETPDLHVLNEAFLEHGMKVCFMAEYFLPDVNQLRKLPCRYEMRVLGPEDFRDLYTEQWSNALCEQRKELDIVGVGAYQDGRLIGLAGASADCEEMWQIGVDVLPEVRRQGVASALTSTLAQEILSRGKVPFYCCAWSNIKSARNAIRSGFRPAWAELTVKPREFVAKMTK